VHRSRTRDQAGRRDFCRTSVATAVETSAVPNERETQMRPHKFFFFLLILFAIAAGYYFYSTDRTSDTVLIGIVDANQVIVSSKIMGRVEKLYVDEGSKVKAGDLIAEIDSAELEAQKNAAQATIDAYGSQVSSMRATEAQTLGETNSGVV